MGQFSVIFQEYIHGNKQIGLIPMTISMMVTYMSTLQVIGFPTEIVVHGVQYWVGNIGVAIGAFLAITVFVPIFYNLEITSVNEVNFTNVQILLNIYLYTFDAVNLSVL